MWRDPLLGPLVLVAAGGALVELLAERSVALPPVDTRRATELVARLRLSSCWPATAAAPPSQPTPWSPRWWRSPSSPTSSAT